MKRKTITCICGIMFVGFMALAIGFSACGLFGDDEDTHQDQTARIVLVHNALTDIDGNQYDALKIGKQVWMASNLRTTHYADGTPIELGSTISYYIPYRYYPGNSPSTVNTCGYLYNWHAVMRNESSSDEIPSGVQGICPTGWHVPSAQEWDWLMSFLCVHEEYRCGSGSAKVAKALASNTGWKPSNDTCAVGNDQSCNNAAEFSAFPAGIYNGYFQCFGERANFWSTTEYDGSFAWYYYIHYSKPYLYTYCHSKEDGYSVRCVRD